LKQDPTTSAPSVSVIIPTYNRANYLTESVESVLQQKHAGSGYEIIVVDDGSTDETAEVLAPHMPHIRYVAQENAGQGAARNHGLQLAQGKYVLFLDSDDVLLPDALSDMLSCIGGQSGIDAVQGGWRYVNASLEKLSESQPWHRSPQLNLDTLIRNSPLFVGGMLCRRACVNQVGGFDTSLKQVEDVDFVIRLGLLGCKFTWLKQSVVLYRQHDSNMTLNALEGCESQKEVDRALFDRPELPEQIRQKKNEVLFYRYAWFAWRLCRAGYKEEVEANLRDSLAWSDLSPEKAFSQWAQHFVHCSLRVGGGIEEYQAMLPHIRNVMDFSEKRWQELKQVTTWWAAVWSRYVENQDLPDGNTSSMYRDLTRNETIALAQQCLLFTPNDEMNLAIDYFFKNSHGMTKENTPRRSDIAGLYLTAFGQAIMARRSRIATTALRNAFAHSGHPRALATWANFVKNSLLYALDSSRNTPKARQ
jgi:glycosyltransferase involved in cell wall biosynthesis